MKKLFLTKEQSNIVELALESHIRGLLEDMENKKMEGGFIKDVVDAAIQQARQVLNTLYDLDKNCPKCSGTGSIHKNCILR